tara:strand:+ start:1126 stop:1512 length:387 start_codon:yes stop_codon:yes gene_type:complete
MPVSKFITISELSKKLDLLNPKNKKPLNHVLRYWENEFYQIKPKIINKRRYYSNEQVELIKLIKFLLKNQGLTIEGAKKVLNSNANKLDDYNSDSLKVSYYKTIIKNKSNKILDKLNKIKKHGKKNTY